MTRTRLTSRELFDAIIDEAAAEYFEANSKDLLSVSDYAEGAFGYCISTDMAVQVFDALQEYRATRDGMTGEMQYILFLQKHNLI